MTRAELVAHVTREAPAYWNAPNGEFICAACREVSMMRVWQPIYEDQINALVLQDVSFGTCDRCEEPIR